VWQVTFDAGGIAFTGYPFPAASVFPKGSVRWDEVASVDPGAAPPEVRLRSGEVLFVPATQRDRFTAVVADRRIPIEYRVDVWSLILEPFLDTEFSSEDQERTLDRLQACGIPREETIAIRRRVGPAMMRYNAIHWDWAHLGLMDLLDAHLLPWPLRLLPWRRARFREVYEVGMKVAARAPRRDESS
jgi:hypothetical protein